MFGFLKKKLKDSLGDLKKAFGLGEKESETPAEETKAAVPEQSKPTLTETSKWEISAPTISTPSEENVPEVPKEVQEKVFEKIEEIEEAEEVKEIAQEIKFEPEIKSPVIETSKTVEEPKKKEGLFSKLFKKKEKIEIKKPELNEPVAPIEAPRTAAQKEKKSGIFNILFEKKLSEEEFDKFFSGLEISLLESNLAYEVIELLKERLGKALINTQIPRGKGDEVVLDTMKETFSEVLLEKDPEDIVRLVEEKRKKNEPVKILFLGVNGVGKTTSLAKLAHWLKKRGISSVFAAADTFRAASMEQLEKHASNLGDIKVIKHKYGGDPAAVAFDAIEHAKARGIDVVLIDSAGRQHTNANLMDELEKVKRVAKPDFTVFVADALTGNDAVEQAREFGEKIGFDFSILGKADVDQKGGAILSVSYISKKPIAFLGVGQGYDDLEEFEKEKLLTKLFKEKD